MFIALGVKATVVYPATDKHIEKYSICQKYVINETPEYYKDITLPYITSSQFSLEVKLKLNNLENSFQ